MKKALMLLLVWLPLVMICPDHSAASLVSFLYDGTNWTNIQYPGGVETFAYGIDGSNIVGWYNSYSYPYEGSFLYNGTNWTTFSYAGAPTTRATGIDGSNIVGWYGPVGWSGAGGNTAFPGKGFLYDGTNWTMTTLLYPPGAIITSATGIDGNNIVGWWWYDYGTQGSFLYDGTNWTPFSYPGACETLAEDIDGSNIVGTYIMGTNPRGFLYDGTNWTTIQYPGADATYVTGIDGNNIVGYFWRSGVGNTAFLYDGTNWTPFQYPGARDTYAYGIDGSNIIGVAVTPEPAAMLLLASGLIGLWGFRRKFRK